MLRTLSHKGHPLTQIIRKSMLAFMALALCFASRDLAAVMALMRKKSLEYGIFILLAWFAGLFVSALIVPLLAREAGAASTGKKRQAIARAVTILILLIPAATLAFAPIARPATGFGSFVFHFLEPFSLSFFLPMAFYFFFGNNESNNTGLLAGTAMAVGHLCWILLIPSLQLPPGGVADIPVDTLVIIQENINSGTLPLLFNLRAVFSAAAGILSGWLIFHAEPQKVMARARIRAAILPPAKKILVPAIFLLIVFFVFSSMTGSLFFPRMNLRLFQPNIINLAILIALPLIGYFCDALHDRFIRCYFAGAVALFLLAAALFLFTPDTVPRHVAHATGALSIETMQLVVLLLIGRYAFATRAPGLVVSLESFTIALSLFAGLLAARLLPGWADAPAALFAVTAILCVLPLAALLRALPKSTADDLDENMESALPPLRPVPLDSIEKISHFAAIHALSEQETNIMRQILDGLSTAGMAAALGISENTVRVYIGRLLRKTGCKNRQQLAATYQQWTPGNAFSEQNR